VAERFMDDFKRFFVRGLAAMLPTLLTLVIIIYVLTFVHQYIGQYVDQFARWVVVQAITLARGETLSFAGNRAVWTFVKADIWAPYHLSWVSFLLAFIVIYVFGRFLASFIGRGLWRTIERAFFRLPVVKQIYPSIKQVTDFLLAERKMEFSRVVGVEYPRKGIWSVGLVTGEAMRTLRGELGGDWVTVFVPSSPTPVTGYTITVRRDDVIDLPISIDEALRFTVSGGVILPPNQGRSRAELEDIRQRVFPPPEKKEITA
jgi:uncharacterized membrane protein